MERVYVSGGIKGVPNHLANFSRGSERVRSQGHIAVNPCELFHKPDATYEDFMREDIRALIDCDAIYMLEGWALSRGARLEHDIAVACGLNLLYEEGGH